ncbi:hypothetical protein EMPS_06810 [Entomortierella parvispora]|uniref:L-arabinokinase n=1 Tax=Entomortierella parvispora TaxID=205924 RepID=A0A9P3LXU1_9FUNG|nr:hypothetical protein EMPS_06810 [Entomortierella parvispora]
MAPSQSKGYTFCYYVSGHGFGHATRVNQIITELLKSTVTTTLPGSTTPVTKSRHTIYIVSDAPQFIFQDVTALGAIYRNAKVDAGVVQPLAYSVDRQATIEGCKKFLSRRDEMIQLEVSWLAQVGADCVLADAPFLPCAAASAHGIPACLITNFTFDEVYRFLREGDPLDKDVMACADAALEDYRKASLLLRLPGSIDIPSFEDEILALESSRSSGSPSISDMDDSEEDIHHHHQQSGLFSSSLTDVSMGSVTPQGVMTPESLCTASSSPNPSVNGSRSSSSIFSTSKLQHPRSTSKGLIRQVIDVPLVVRKAINTREDVLRSLGVDEETIKTKKMVLVSFGGQRLKQGWGNPLPEGWIGVICGLPVEHELPEGFYRSPHGVYVPDLTEAADIVIGKLGYGTCSECIAHDTPLIYVPRPQFIEEHGLIKMMINHGLPVEMTAEEFETGNWQRSILEADRQATEEREGRRLFMESCEASEAEQEDEEVSTVTPALTLAESVNMGELAEPEPLVNAMSGSRRRSRRSSSVTSLSAFRPKGPKMARLTPPTEEAPQEKNQQHAPSHCPSSAATTALTTVHTPPATEDEASEDAELEKAYVPSVWFERRIPHNGGEVCARLVEEFLFKLTDGVQDD